MVGGPDGAVGGGRRQACSTRISPIGPNEIIGGTQLRNADPGGRGAIRVPFVDFEGYGRDPAGISKTQISSDRGSKLAIRKTRQVRAQTDESGKIQKCFATIITGENQLHSRTERLRVENNRAELR